MPEHTFSDRLINSFNAKAQDWGAATENEQLAGRALLRRRDAYYKALRELTEYVRGLERSIEELQDMTIDKDTEIDKLRGELADILADMREKEQLIRHQQQTIGAQTSDIERLSRQIENRNRMSEQGPDEIGKEYIQRLGIPELTEVFNRTVLGHA